MSKNKKCCSPKRQCKKCQSSWQPKLDRFQDVLLSASYIMCSVLIVFSLMMYVSLLASGPNKSKNLIISLVDKYYSSEAITGQLLAVEEFGYKMGEPLQDTIKMYSDSLLKVFEKTGNTLAKVPQVLTGTLPVQARGYR